MRTCVQWMCRGWVLGGGLALWLGGCSQRQAPPAVVDLGRPDAAVSLAAPIAPTQAAVILKKGPPTHAPLSMEELPTTEGQIAIENLEGSIASMVAFAKVRPTDAVIQNQIVQLLCVRAQFRGTLSDYDRAEAQVGNALRVAPKAAHTWMARAQVRAVFHDFLGAEQDLRTAEQLDGDLRGAVERARLSLWVAQGKEDEALAAYRTLRERAPDLSTIVGEAALRGDRGELDEAERLFVLAPHYFHDVSPFPMAWLYLQHGLLWEHAGNLARAEELFSAAVTRLPAYATATSHLAGVLAARGKKEQAITLLRGLVRSAEDPEYKGQLAGLLTAPEDAAEATQLTEAAKKQYATLLTKHPMAFAAHAARFYLGVGKQAGLAQKLAEQNVQTQKTVDAYTLAIEAALANKAVGRACGLAEELSRRPGLADTARVVASRAFSACNKPAEAAAIVTPKEGQTK